MQRLRHSAAGHGTRRQEIRGCTSLEVELASNLRDLRYAVSTIHVMVDEPGVCFMLHRPGSDDQSIHHRFQHLMPIQARCTAANTVFC